MPAQSKQQQKFMGMVHALKKGEMDPKDASPELKKAAQSMDNKDAKDFASTKHKGLPRKVKQEIVNKLKEYANKMGTNTMGGDDYTSSKRGGLRDFDGYDNVDYNKDMPMDESFASELDIIKNNSKNLKDFIKKVFSDSDFRSLKGDKDFIKYLGSIYEGIVQESNLKGQLADDSVQDIIKSIGSRFVSGEIKNTKRDGKTYIKLKDEKFGSGVVKILKSKFGIDAKVDYYGGKGTIVSTPSVSFYSDTILEGKIPNNWMQGRTSDYHTKLGTTPRDKYDDTNFRKDNSGQPDLEDEQNEGASDVNKAVIPSDIKIKLQRALDVLDGKKLSYPQKLQVLGRVLDSMGIDKGELNKVSQRLRSKLESIEEGDLEDTIYQVKKFDKPKDGKLLTIKVINKLKDKRNKSNSSSNKQKLQQMIDKIEGDYKKGKFLTEAPVFHAMNNPRFKKATSDLVKNKKVKNPETGKDVQVTTALKDKDHPAHNQAKSFFQRLKGMMKNESINESLDYKKIHDGIFKFLKTKKGVGEVKEFPEFPNRYGDNVSTYYVKYNIEDKYNYDSQEIKIEYSTSRVFIPNKGYFPFKTFNDIKNIINKKSSLKESIKSEYASNQTLSYLPADEEEIEKMNETMIRRAVDIAQELLPKDTWARFSSDGKKNAEFVKNVVRDLTQSLNRFYKNHNISVKIQENEGDSNVDMVLGVLSILRQIDDKENRKRVAVDMIKKFKEQDIDFDYQEFIDLMKEYSMGSYEYNK